MAATQPRRRRRKDAPPSGSAPDESATPGMSSEDVPVKLVDPEVTRLANLIQERKDKIHNPLTAIRAMCIECMGGYVELVNKCTSTNCALHAFRQGKNTMSKRYGRANPDAFKTKGGDDDE